MKRALALAVLVAVALPLTACSDKTDPTTTVDPSQATQPTAGQPATPQPEGAARDLRDPSCTADADGAWSFSARLENTSDKPSEYTVTVSVVKKEGSTVVGSGEQVVTVDPAQTADVTLDRFATPEEPADELMCVPTTTVHRG